MKWYYANAGTQSGPVEDAEFDSLIGQGMIRGDTLVWNEGMPAWQPLSVVRGWPNTGAQAAPPVPGQVHALRYAGFWVRFVARVIDGFLLGVVNFFIRIPLAVMLGVRIGMGRGFGRYGPGGVFQPAFIGMLGISILISIAVGVVYEVYFVSTRGGTLGKLALGLKIVRADGSPVDAGLATGRYFAMWLSAIILWIGYIMAGFDDQKRALHDYICNTRVIHVR